MADNIKCLTTYRTGNLVQHVVLFKDGSEIVVDERIPILLLWFLDRDVLVDWMHVMQCFKWSDI